MCSRHGGAQAGRVRMEVGGVSSRVGECLSWSWGAKWESASAGGGARRVLCSLISHATIARQCLGGWPSLPCVVCTRWPHGHQLELLSELSLPHSPHAMCGICPTPCVTRSVLSITVRLCRETRLHHSATVNGKSAIPNK